MHDIASHDVALHVIFRKQVKLTSFLSNDPFTCLGNAMKRLNVRGLRDSLRGVSFRFTGGFENRDEETFLMQLFSCPMVQEALFQRRLEATAVESVEYHELRCGVLSMNFFDRLKNGKKDSLPRLAPCSPSTMKQNEEEDDLIALATYSTPLLLQVRFARREEELEACLRRCTMTCPFPIT